MRHSLEVLTNKLSLLQRCFLVDHVDGMRPFVNSPIENRTRKSLVERGMLRYEPETRSLLGVPLGTILTDDGRESLCAVLGECADAIERTLLTAEPNFFRQHLEMELRTALRECSTEWRAYELREQTLTPPQTVIAHAYDRPAVPALKQSS